MSTPRVLGIVAALVVLAVPAGCGSDDSPASGRDTTASPTSAPTTQHSPSPTNEMGCVSKMPGEILTEAEAVVAFSTTKACPGYVTIRPGTEVTFRNEDSVAHRITINGTNATGEKLPVVANGTAQPGATWAHTFDDLGMFSYTLDAIPTFRGTVEVTENDSAHHG